MSLQATTKTEILKQQTELAFFFIVELVHADITTMRFCDNNVDIVYSGNTYSSYGFKLIPPKQIDGEMSNAKITISNIDRSIVSNLRTIQTAPELNFAVVSVTGAGVVTLEVGWYNCKLRNVKYNAQTISGDLHYDIWVSDYASQVRYTNTMFPSLYA